MTNDGTPMALMANDEVAPGATYTYHWQVPERAGPGSNDPSSIVWLYHSHVETSWPIPTAASSVRIVVARKGEADGE